MMFAESFLAELKARTPLHPLVSRKVKLAKKGKEWKGLCPFHKEKTPSFTVYPDGHFHCFGCGKTGDVITFVREAEGGTFDEVVKRLASQAGMDLPSPAGGNGLGKSSNPTPQDDAPDEIWVPILPVPASAPRLTEAQRACDMLHDYLDADGRLLCLVRRIEGSAGKLFLPLTFGTLTKKGEAPLTGWHQKAPNAPRPLYGLDRLAQAGPHPRVLLCEGEKAANAAQRLFPDRVCMTWMGGVNSAHHADWTPLQACEELILWADADKVGQGQKAMEYVASQLPSARMLDIAGLSDLKDGFDAADLAEHPPNDPEVWLELRTPEPILIFTDEPWDPATLPLRPWIAPPYIMRGQITLPHGPGGGGKSTVIVTWAVALALGKTFGRLKPKQRYRVLLPNFEDDAIEQMKRISAALEFFGATPDELKGWLIRVRVGRGHDATMFDLDEHGAVRRTATWSALVDACKRYRPDVVAIDTLIAVNAVPENDNQLMRRVFVIIKGDLGEMLNAAIIVAHHDNKAGDSSEESDQTNARGGGDIVNAVRIELAVKKMTMAQAEAWNVEPERRGFYFRVGSPTSKMNYSAPEESEWFERLPVVINGEQVVRCIPWEPPSSKLNDEQKRQLLDVIGKGTATGPYSPQVGGSDRSLGKVMADLGIVAQRAQRRVLTALLDSRRVVKARWKVPGHGVMTRVGLRTDAGLPYNYEWQDGDAC